MPTPFPHQIEGARFLASGGVMLADDPRVGKTGAAVMACDLVLARRVLVVTTATGRANFGREFGLWQAFPRRVQVLYGATERIAGDTEVLVVGWSILADRGVLDRLHRWQHDVLVLDESHYAKNPDAKRTQAAMGLAHVAERVFMLTGTPMPNAPNDLWPMLNAVDASRIDNMTYDAFLRRYCYVRQKWVSGRRIDVVMGGKNLPELRERLKGFWLRRTQADVGIREPIYSVLALEASGLPAVDDETVQAVLDAAEAGDTGTLDMHMGELRRVTGQIKAVALAELLLEELQNGLDKVVLMCWHQDVIDQLAGRLALHGVSTLDGRTPAAKRLSQVEKFQTGSRRVFVGQMQAAGEAIDLSSSCNLVFAEASFVPKDMRQAALRITNHGQKRQCLVRFAALAGSIDEALTAVLTRKVATIKEVLKA
ncbi:MAG: DEAD/DEAH box helicase [Methylorubrum rhodinum]|uniref:SNF2-related protein n=1 Tax=Methylorubrum rhodinum TaxID=29428 RepID=UPI003BAF0F01